MRPLLVAFSVALSLNAQPRRPAFDPSKLVDLSYSYDKNTIYWPTSPPFEWKKDAWGKSEGGYWYASGTVTTSEHGGTHIDSPLHFAESKQSTADIPLRKLAGPAAVVDVSASCARSPDYLVTAADLENWERAHGKLQPVDIVLIRTGWGARWPNAKAYLGTDKRDVSALRFPGISPEAAKLLVARNIAGVGIDTASIDYGRSKDFQTHRILNAANIYALENVANIDKLPLQGATLIALPIKTAGGTGGPVRIAAILP